MDIFDKLKPYLCDLIEYYYNDLGNSAGGNLHICLDDGNLEPMHIWSCQEDCQEVSDDLGYMIGTIMRTYSTEELETLYENGWKKK